MKLIITFVFLMMSSFAMATTSVDCANADNTMAIVDCHSNRYQVADKRLNAIYTAAMKALTEDEKSALKTAQKTWLKYRDANFSFVIEMNKDSGSYANIAISNFKADFVENRVTELKAILAGPGETPDWLSNQ